MNHINPDTVHRYTVDHLKYLSRPPPYNPNSQSISRSRRTPLASPTLYRPRCCRDKKKQSGMRSSWPKTGIRYPRGQVHSRLREQTSKGIELSQFQVSWSGMLLSNIRETFYQVLTVVYALTNPCGSLWHELSGRLLQLRVLRNELLNLLF